MLSTVIEKIEIKDLAETLVCYFNDLLERKVPQALAETLVIQLSYRLCERFN